jgi:hypothetical protein
MWPVPMNPKIDVPGPSIDVSIVPGLYVLLIGNGMPILEAYFWPCVVNGLYNFVDIFVFLQLYLKLEVSISLKYFSTRGSHMHC